MQGPSQRDNHELEENDDETERMARREQSFSSSIWSHKSSSYFSKFPNLSSLKLYDQIMQCLKLSAENKISEKNAFQLHLIDFLNYSLTKQDDRLSNLQMASACLDASSKIYGYRVDKVHLDLMKVVGHVERGEKRGYEYSDNDNIQSERQRKRKKKNYHIFSSVESLKGNLNTYNPLSLINTQNDIQTSDMLFQASLPCHANQGIALNLYKDVLLDRLPSDKYNITKALTALVDDFTADHLCPSYAGFKFLGWLPKDELDLDQKSASSMDEDENCEFHFNLDDPNYNDRVNNIVMNYSDVIENSNSIGQNIQNVENIIDFQDIIKNNPNGSCEYSYMELNSKLDCTGASHWKVKVLKNSKAGKSVAKKRNKSGCLSYSRNLKEFICTRKYITRKKANVNAAEWSAEKNEFPSNLDDQDNKKFYEYILKPGEANKISESGIRDGQNNSIRDQDDLDLGNSLDLSKIDCGISFDSDISGEHDFTQQLEGSNDALEISRNENFMGDNLVTLPSIVPKIFIPYSQRAKKIDMRKINKATEEILQKIENKNENIRFSEIYQQLPQFLPQSTAKSLSPGLSFISLLQIAHKKNLVVQSQNSFCDLDISTSQKKR